MKSERLSSHSDTDAMASMYVDHSRTLDEYAKHFTAEPGQIGAVFSIGGQVCGLELFDCQQTFKSLMPKLVRSYALDAIDEQASQFETLVNTTAAGFMDALGKAETQAFDSLGEGEDIRLVAPALSGGALVARDRVVHLCAFRLGISGESRTDGDRHSMASASHRRRMRVTR